MASYIRSLVSFLAAQFNARVADQQTREEFYRSVVVFSRRQPFLASFIAIQLLFGILPVLGFIGFALGVLGVALGFVTFWVGVGLCIMFSILLATATIATCVWISAVSSLICFRWVLRILYGSAPKQETRMKKPVDKDAAHENVRRGDQIAVKVGGDEGGQKTDEDDTEGSDDTVGSYGALNQYTNRVKNEDLKRAQPVPVSDAEKMRRDIERSLK